MMQNDWKITADLKCPFHMQGKYLKQLKVFSLVTTQTRLQRRRNMNEDH